MRQIGHQQLPLTPVPNADPHTAELRTIGATLDAFPDAVRWVRDDLIRRPGKRIDPNRAPTWERINQELVRYAARLRVEKGTTVRTDCTVVESNIHHPTD